MAKLTLNDVSNMSNELSYSLTINNNSAAIEDALENTLSRDGTTPNQMEADLDMNSNRILNLPAPNSGGEPIRLGDLSDLVDVSPAIVSDYMVTLLNDVDSAEARATLETGGLNTTNTWTAAQTIETSSATPLNITMNDDGAGIGPIITLLRESTSPAASDIIGAISMQGRNSIGSIATYGRIFTDVVDATSGSTDGRLNFQTHAAGSLSTLMQLSASSLDIANSVSLNVSAPASIAISSGSTALTLSSTDAGAGHGPSILLDRNSASPAAFDSLSQIIFRGRDSGGNATDYAVIATTITDTTDGSEDAEFAFYSQVAGVSTKGLGVGNGVVIGVGASLGVSGSLKVTATTASSSTTTGALVVAGGAGIAGTAWANALVATNAGGVRLNSASGGGMTGSATYLQFIDPSGGNPFSVGGTGDPTNYFSNDTLQINNRNNSVNILNANATRVNVQLTTASTSTTTGALIVAGGAGVAGQFTGGTVVSAGQVLSAGATIVQFNTAMPAGGVAGAGLRFSTTSNFGIFFGSGVPTLSAAQGSIYLRSDGSSTTTRVYVNTNGTTGWTNVVTSA